MLTSVYQKVLGEDFVKLTPVLKFSHGEITYMKSIGTIDVEYGKNKLIRFMNKISGMPPEGRNMNLVLEITRFENKEIWKRSFNGKIFSTVQSARKGKLYEKSGPVNMIFQLSVKNGSLYFEQNRTTFAGIPLPHFMGIQSSAASVEEGNGWKVSVEVRSPIFGLMLRYSGEVLIQKGDN